MTGIILSGGKNIRMGTNKAFLEVDGERIIDRTIRIFEEIFEETIIVTNEPLAYVEYDVKIVTDIIKGKAALGGIYTGLFYASSDYAFVAPCDMPFLNKTFIQYMQSLAVHTDIVVPVPADGYQPLHAIYSRKCLPFIKKQIDRDKLKIRGFYKHCKVTTIPEDVLKSFDGEGAMFQNMNSQSDLEKIQGQCRVDTRG